MNSLYLTEAFKELNLLNEDVFNPDDEGISDLKELISSEDDVINIIDDEATTPEELEDSYVGKVVLDCCVCHSKLYKDADSVVINEDSDLANEGEECPYCYSTDGFKIIGQIAPYEEEAELKVEVEDKPEDESDEVEETEVEEETVEESLKEEVVGQDVSEFQKWVDYDMEKYHKISNNTMDKIKKAGLSVVKDQYGDYEVIASRKDEAFEKVELETEDKVIKVSEEEKEEVPDAEMIEPLDIDTKTEIVDSTLEETEDEEDVDDMEVSDDGFVESDFDEFEEEDFNDLGESYLKKVYENVNTFKTTKVTTKGNTLKLEGLIKFNSGNERPTTFLFEAKDITKKGKLRFIGENLQISRGKKSFTLTGSIKNNKLISESLNYNYRTKDNNGKSVRLYGTIKR